MTARSLLTTHAIPTMYRGTQFRSRLEARWAALFDQLPWPWAYEPVDLDGYVPDFVLGFRVPLLVEVKPDLDLGALGVHLKKIARSGWTGEAVVVGARLFDNDNGFGHVLGAMLERGPDIPPDGVHAQETCSLTWCAQCRGPSVHSTHGSWHCRRCGASDGNPFRPLDGVQEAWATAGNAVQWRGAQSEGWR